MAASSASRTLGRHALVIGGSMAGLCAARVLSERFERVTLLERDPLPDSMEPRKGVPQGRHLHGLLRGGEDMLAEWFPGLVPALLAAGAVRITFGQDFRWFHFGAWKIHVPGGVGALGLSRPLLEGTVRRFVFALPNVQRRDECDVLGLTMDPERKRVTGAVVRARGADAREETLEADLVVDTSGRGSQTPKWLEGLGRTRPPETTVRVDVGYASRIYRRPPEGTVPWKACYVLGRSPESRRLGVIFSIEGGRWMSVVAGLLGDHPPSDEAGFAAYARALPHPAIARALERAEPLSDVMLYKFPAHQRRHYERLRDMPDGLVVLGDAYCSFNPIYGQGMTCAALGARTLAGALEAHGGKEGFSARFQRDLARAMEGPWMMSTGEDFRYPEVQGDRPLINPVMQWFTAQVHQACARDPGVARDFYRAMNMLTPVSALLRPGFALRVLRSARAPLPVDALDQDIPEAPANSNAA